MKEPVASRRRCSNKVPSDVVPNYSYMDYCFIMKHSHLFRIANFIQLMRKFDDIVLK